MHPSDRPHVLYLTRNGLLEPLGQSQVLAYLRGLSRRFRITVISFEKPTDRANRAEMERVAADCANCDIRWLPQPFRYRPRYLAPAWSICIMLWISLRLARREGVSLIHARSYVPAAVALLVNRLTGLPFIFDMRALWPEELIVAGQMTQGSLLHRVIVRLERSCLKNAAAVVSLTRAAVTHLRQLYPGELERQRIAVIPTCADLDRFTSGNQQVSAPIYGCVGSVLNRWFRFEWLLAFISAAAEKHKDARFEIVTKDDPDEVRVALGAQGNLGDRIHISSSPHHLVHESIRRHSASIMFYSDDLSRLGCSPTRLAEALGCGVPIVTNSGFGDTAEIVEEYRIGVLASGCDPEAMRRAVDAIDQLIGDAEAPLRCRRAAEALFSLEAGTKAYASLYDEIIRDRSHEAER